MDDPKLLFTAHGEQLDLNDPDPASIRLEDLAVHLSREHRFSGAVGLTVAAHSLNMAHAVRARSPRDRLRCLLHDGAEYLLRDLPWPVKRAMPTGSTRDNSYVMMEGRLQYAIYTRFGVFRPPHPRLFTGGATDPAWLKTMDAMMVRTEARSLLTPDQHATLLGVYPGKHYEGSLLYWVGDDTVQPFIDTGERLVREMEAARVAEAVSDEELRRSLGRMIDVVKGKGA